MFVLLVDEGRVEVTNDNNVLIPSSVNTSEIFFGLCLPVFEGIEECLYDTDILTSRAVLVLENIKLGDIDEIFDSHIPEY